MGNLWAETSMACFRSPFVPVLMGISVSSLDEAMNEKLIYFQ